MVTSEPFFPENRLNNTITPAGFVDINGVDYTQLGSLAKFANTESFNPQLALEYKERPWQSWPAS